MDIANTLKREVYRNLHFRNETVYSVRKEGLVEGHALMIIMDGTTKPCVLEFGCDGIRLNAVLPGLFATSLADVFTPEQILKATQKTSLERLWRPKNRPCRFVFGLAHS